MIWGENPEFSVQHPGDIKMWVFPVGFDVDVCASIAEAPCVGNPSFLGDFHVGFEKKRTR